MIGSAAKRIAGKITRAIVKGLEIKNITRPWILETGFWDDAGEWEDTAHWNDGVAHFWILASGYWEDSGGWRDTSFWIDGP